jgi:tetratricopeptide (TPR) repeat protein
MINFDFNNEFIIERIYGRNVNSIHYDIFSEILQVNKSKEIIRYVREFSYDYKMLDMLINHCLQNNDIESLNNNYIIKINNTNILGRMFFNLGEKYRIIKNYEQMKKYYLLAITNNCFFASHNLGIYYLTTSDPNKLIKAEEYLLIGVNNNIHQSFHAISKLYIVMNNFENTKKYLLLCFNKFRCPTSVHQLAYYYYHYKQNYDAMKKYYEIAIKAHYTPSMRNLGNYFKSINDYDNLLKYYKMAINYNDIESLFQLADYYYSNKINYDLVKNYCELAINNANYSKAWSLLGKYYLLIMKNETIGKKMLEKSIKLGYFQSYVILANFEYEKKDYTKMFDYLNKALDNNHYNAYYHFAIYYINIENNGEKLKEYALLSIEKKKIFGQLLIAKYYKSYDFNVDKITYHIKEFFNNLKILLNENNINIIKKILSDEDIIEISKLFSELPDKFNNIVENINKS